MNVKEKIKIPNELPFANLPPLLKKGVEVFDNIEQQLLMTYSIITAISSLLINVKGIYDQRECSPNLYFMALGNAGTGKGIIVHVRQLMQKINEIYLKKSISDLEQFKARKNKKEVPPAFRTVIIPGNITQAKLLKHLSDNHPNVPSLIIETEMDTISNAIASDHGNFSAVIRNGFQNEPISKSIVQNSEFIDIKWPQPALVLSGTPGQLFSFINNREDGLLSRFLIMDFKGYEGWKNVGPCPDCINLTEFFDGLSDEYLSFYKTITKASLRVCLTEKQWKSIESYGTEKLKEISETYGAESNGIIKRNGLILFKMCMTLTSLRKYENQNTDSEVFCSDTDFETALYLIDQSLYSVLDAWESLPYAGKKSFNKNSQFYSSLTESFTRAEAIKIGKNLSISERTTDRYLNNFLENGKLKHPSKGSYLKPEN